MRVLFLNQFFAPDAAATAQLLADLCGGLAKQGAHVSVICARTGYSDSSARAGETAGCAEGVSVHRLPSLPFRRNSLLARLTSYVSFMGLAALRGLFSERPDVVVALTTPPFVGLVGVLLKRLRGCRFVLWSMDLYPEVAIAAGAIRADGVAARGARAAARLIYRHADAVVALGPFMRARILAHGVPAGKAVIVHNWANGELFRPLPEGQAGLRSKLGLDDCFIVMYSGNMGVGHSFDTIMDVACAFEDDPSVRFVFVGDGSHRRDIEERVERDRLANVMLLPYQPRDRLHDSLRAGDVHLISLRECMQGLMAPSKLYGILAAGRPCVLVGGEANEVAEIIRKHRCGLVVKEGDAAGLKAALVALAHRPRLADAMARRARQAFLAAYDMPFALSRWLELLESQCRAARRSGKDVLDHSVRADDTPQERDRTR